MNEKTNSEKTQKSITGPILLSLIGFFVYSLCFFPIILLGLLLYYLLPFTQLWHFLLLPFIIYIGIILLVVSLILISGSFIRLFNIRYKPGIFTYSFNEKNSFRWMILCALYTPCRKLFEFFPLGNLKNTYYRLLGMKIGKNSLVG